MPHARQLVLHGHVKVNDKRVDVPSYAVQPGDRIALSEKAKQNAAVQQALQALQKRGPFPSWIEVNASHAAGKVRSWPSRDEMSYPIDEQLIVELYSKIRRKFRMKLRDLVLPQSLECDQETLTDTFGRFYAEPFEKGYGHTIGNSLRRILLSSLEGCAVAAVKIDKVAHEYSVIKGVREDVVTILLNLKQLRFKLHTPEPEILTLSVKGERVVRAKDIEANANVEILTPDLPIATLGHQRRAEHADVGLPRPRLCAGGKADARKIIRRTR